MSLPLLPTESNPWQIISSTEVYQNPWIQLTEYKVLNPNGNKGIYGKVHFKNTAIGIVAMDTEQHIYLVGQYRFPTNHYSWELPEGGGSMNENPQDAAKRELLEETGLLAESWTELLKMDLSNSVTDEQCIVYLAQNLTQMTPQPEDSEKLAVIKCPFNELLQRVMNNEITDAITIAAILKLKALGY